MVMLEGDGAFLGAEGSFNGIAAGPHLLAGSFSGLHVQRALHSAEVPRVGVCAVVVVFY